MGTWGPPPLTEEMREFIKEQNKKLAAQRERDRRNAIREDARRDQGDDSMSTVMGLYALNSYATHMAGAAMAYDSGEDSSPSTDTSTSVDSTTGSMD